MSACYGLFVQKGKIKMFSVNKHMRNMSFKMCINTNSKKNIKKLLLKEFRFFFKVVSISAEDLTETSTITWLVSNLYSRSGELVKHLDL